MIINIKKKNLEMISVISVELISNKIKAVGRWTCMCTDGILCDLISKVSPDLCFLNIPYFGLEL